MFAKPNIIKILCLLVIFFGTYFFVRESDFTKTEIKDDEVIIVKNSREKKQTIYAKYPKFNNIPNEEIRLEVNRQLKEVVDEQISKFEQESSQIKQKNPLKSYLFINYIIRPTNNSIISVPFSISYYLGEYRSKTYDIVFNYDTLKNKQLLLKDLFGKDTGYLKMLSEIASSDLKKQQKDFNLHKLIDQGTTADDNNFKNFSISSDFLYLVFNPPQVAPEKERTKIVAIPLKSIQQYLNNQYLSN